MTRPLRLCDGILSFSVASTKPLRTHLFFTDKVTVEPMIAVDPVTVALLRATVLPVSGMLKLNRVPVSCASEGLLAGVIIAVPQPGVPGRKVWTATSRHPPAGSNHQIFAAFASQSTISIFVKFEPVL